MSWDGVGRALSDLDQTLACLKSGRGSSAPRNSIRNAVGGLPFGPRASHAARAARPPVLASHSEADLRFAVRHAPDTSAWACHGGEGVRDDVDEFQLRVATRLRRREEELSQRGSDVVRRVHRREMRQADAFMEAFARQASFAPSSCRAKSHGSGDAGIERISNSPRPLARPPPFNPFNAHRPSVFASPSPADQDLVARCYQPNIFAWSRHGCEGVRDDVDDLQLRVAARLRRRQQALDKGEFDSVMQLHHREMRDADAFMQAFDHQASGASSALPAAPAAPQFATAGGEGCQAASGPQGAAKAPSVPEAAAEPTVSTAAPASGSQAAVQASQPLPPANPADVAVERPLGAAASAGGSAAVRAGAPEPCAPARGERDRVAQASAPAPAAAAAVPAAWPDAPARKSSNPVDYLDRLLKDSPEGYRAAVCALTVGFLPQPTLVPAWVTH